MSKTTKEPSSPAPLPQPSEGIGAGIVHDAFHGIGGSYILDTETGQRTPNQAINSPEIDKSTKG